tara:strand:- start:11255 stop:11656 length:402 start_codon:yes stop_codon:yes gene_type:complete
MSAKKDLQDILKAINPSLVDEFFIFMTSKEPINNLVNSLNPIAMFIENEGSTLVITKEIADRNSIHYDAVFKCISLGVHSSLESSGLIAIISGELSKQDIPANVFAGYFHDHIFVPSNKAEKALEIISSIRSS